jgi:hypothetical protein
MCSKLKTIVINHCLVPHRADVSAEAASIDLAETKRVYATKVLTWALGP